MFHNLIAINVSNQGQDDADGVHQLVAPVGMTLVGVVLCAEAFTGTPTGFNIDVQDDTTDIVTAVAANTAKTEGTWYTPIFGGTNTPVEIAAGSNIEIDVNLTGGSTPTADYDCTLWFLLGTK